MKILVATGRQAEGTVRKSVKSKADVLIVDTDIAAFITPSRLLFALKDQNPGTYDILFIPGLASGDFSAVEEKMDCKVYLGPKHAYDIGYVLDFVEDFEFSKNIPACELLSDIRKKLAIDKVDDLEDRSVPQLLINDLKIGGSSRMKVMAEIVDSTSMSKELLVSKIEEFVQKGADIIDLGSSMNATPEEVKSTVKTARSVSSVPISIDTLEPDLIKNALEAGVDIVLSLNGSNIDQVGKHVAFHDATAVIIPDSNGDIGSLADNIKKAKNSGIEYIIADPVLDPVGHGITRSIVRYYEFSKDFPGIPLFFGSGNVTELIDADSIGVNAVLCGIASEIGAAILFTPEYSDKTHGSIEELTTASMMMTVASERNSSPKDLGIDLLKFKEKRKRNEADLCEDPLFAVESESWELDPKGPVKIGIVSRSRYSDSPFKGSLIIAQHKRACIVGKTASSVLNTLIEKEFVSTLGHAGYLGRELARAELAIKYDRSYAQDDDF